MSARTAAFRTQDPAEVYETGAVRVVALDGVSLTRHAVELTVLLGPSGSRKSTLLNMRGGLDHPTSGRVWFRAEELTAMSPPP